MAKRIDCNLNLEQLLTQCKELEPEEMIRIYFDPTTYWFHISYVGIMEFWIPPEACFICESRAENARLGIEFYIASAVRMLTNPDQV